MIWQNNDANDIRVLMLYQTNLGNGLRRNEVCLSNKKITRRNTMRVDAHQMQCYQKIRTHLVLELVQMRSFHFRQESYKTTQRTTAVYFELKVHIQMYSRFIILMEKYQELIALRFTSRGL